MRFKTLFEFKNILPFLNEFYTHQGGINLLSQLFEHQAHGVFIDIGPRHPVMHSNTICFYKKGWRGININPAPGAIMAFEALRPGDTNLQLLVSDKEEQVPFFVFNEPAGQAVNDAYVSVKDSKQQHRIKDIITVKTNTLAKILDGYLPANQPIRFLAVNAGGDDQKILASNNWLKYRPEVILLESELSYSAFNNSTLNRFMIQKGYELFARKGNTCFLKDSRKQAS